MSATETVANPRVENVVVREGTAKITMSVIRNIPGGPEGEEYIILVKPIVGRGKGEVFADDKDRLRSWGTQKFFEGSANCPEGLEIGLVNYLTEPDTGQPWIERSVLQIGDDAYLRLEAWATNQPYLSMTERRRLAKESEKFQMTSKAGRIQAPGAKSPEQALQDLTDEKMQAQIARIVAEKVAEALGKARGPK